MCGAKNSPGVKPGRVGPIFGLGAIFAGFVDPPFARLDPAAPADFSELALALPFPFESTGFNAGEARADGVLRTLLAFPLAEGCGGARNDSSVIGGGIERAGAADCTACGSSAGLFCKDERADETGSKWSFWTAWRAGESDERPFMSKSEAKFIKVAGVMGLRAVGGRGGGPIDSVSGAPACEIAAFASVAASRRPPGATRGWWWYCTEDAKSTGLGVSIPPALPPLPFALVSTDGAEPPSPGEAPLACEDDAPENVLEARSPPRAMVAPVNRVAGSRNGEAVALFCPLERFSPGVLAADCVFRLLFSRPLSAVGLINGLGRVLLRPLLAPRRPEPGPVPVEFGTGSDGPSRGE